MIGAQSVKWYLIEEDRAQGKGRASPVTGPIRRTFDWSRWLVPSKSQHLPPSMEDPGLMAFRWLHMFSRFQAPEKLRSCASYPLTSVVHIESTELTEESPGPGASESDAIDDHPLKTLGGEIFAPFGRLDGGPSSINFLYECCCMIPCRKNVLNRRLSP
ncbi:hypothetical protein BDV11DRAFT_99784 [Aspergillus similis]